MSDTETKTPESARQPTDCAAQPAISKPAPKPVGETGGPQGLEPTRYGDWERAGRCVDF